MAGERKKETCFPPQKKTLDTSTQSTNEGVTACTPGNPMLPTVQVCAVTLTYVHHHDELSLLLYLRGWKR